MSEIADIAKEAFHILKRPRYTFAVWVTGVLALTVPLPDFLKLDSIRDEFGKYIGAVCLFTFVLWVVEVAMYLWTERKDKRDKKKEEDKQLEAKQKEENEKQQAKQKEESEKQEAKKREEEELLSQLNYLETGELDLLVSAINSQQTTVTWNKESQSAASLCQKKLLVKVPFADNTWAMHVPFTIPKTVWDRINQPEVAAFLKKRLMERQAK